MNQGFGSDGLRLSDGRAVRPGSSKVVWLLCLHVPPGHFHVLVQARDERSPEMTFRSDSTCNCELK